MIEQNGDDLNQLDSRNIIRVPDYDIAALRLGEVNTMEGRSPINYFNAVTQTSSGQGVISVNHREKCRPHDELKIGNEAFTIGYPNSIGLINNKQFDYTRPLLRKGIIAGKNPAMKTIILDCPVYFGNSGGPVVEIYRCGEHCRKNHFSLIGIVSQFIPFQEDWVNTRFKTIKTEFSNSGYSVITPLDTLFELIDKESGGLCDVEP